MGKSDGEDEADPVAQILDFTKGEDQIEIQYLHTGMDSVTSQPVTKDEASSDCSIVLTITFEASEANGNEFTNIIKEVAVIKDFVGGITDEDVFLRTV